MMPPYVVSMDNGGSPYAAANNARAANINKMASLQGINTGGSKKKYKYVKKGGDTTITVQDIPVPYPNTGGLNKANIILTKVNATSSAQRVGDNAWKQNAGSSRKKRSSRKKLSSRKKRSSRRKLSSRRRK